MTGVKFRSDSDVALIDHMGSERRIMQVAQLSTLGSSSLDSGKSPARFVRWLYKEGHGSPFESCVLTLKITTPIFVSRQIVKHRISSINEVSGRYSEPEPVFYIPGQERPLAQVGKTGDCNFESGTPYARAAASSILAHAALDSWADYLELRDHGVAKEVARMVMPVSLYTDMAVTMNLRSLLNFVALRATEAPSHGQYEIAEVADKIGVILAELYPNVWQAFVENNYKAI